MLITDVLAALVAILGAGLLLIRFLAWWWSISVLDGFVSAVETAEEGDDRV